jgi:hypothetical protein
MQDIAMTEPDKRIIELRIAGKSRAQAVRAFGVTVAHEREWADAPAYAS